MTPDDITHPEPKVAPDQTDTLTPPCARPAEACLDRIAEAHTRVLDTVAGFGKVVQKAQPGFRPVAEAFLAMHVRHEGELATHLQHFGRDPGDDGSFFGTVNRTAVEIKSWFEDVTDGMMDQIKAGELHVLDAYSDAQDDCRRTDTGVLLARHINEIDAMMRKHSA